MLPINERIVTKEQLRDYLEIELKAYGGSRIYDCFHFTEFSILRRYITLLRKAEFYTNTHAKLCSVYYKLRLYRLGMKYGINIPLKERKKGLKICHVGPILVSNNAIVGEHCSIHINTGIVAGGNTNKAPTLGNNIVIGIGAVLLGDITIADNVAIGANAVVNRSILEPSITVAGVPAKKISDNGKSSWEKLCALDEKGI